MACLDNYNLEGDMGKVKNSIFCIAVILVFSSLFNCAEETKHGPALKTTASPAGGDFPSFSPPSVTLTATKPATIYYSTDGYPPKPGMGNTLSGRSPLFVEPGPLRKDTVLKFYALDDRETQEVVRTEVYNIIQPPLTTASPPGGSYNNRPFNIELEAKADPPALPKKIYYTVDGSSPTISSTGFDSPTLVTLLNEGPTLVRFFATDSVGNTETPIKNILYLIDSTAPVTTVSPAGCQLSYIGGQCPIQDLTGCTPLTGPTTIKLTSSEPAIIYYSVDGKDPNINNTVDKGGNTFSGSTPVSVNVNATTTLKYFAIDLVGNAESIHTAFYKVGTGPISTACPKGGTFNYLPFTITIVASPLTPTATIYYTLDGSTPTGGTASSQPAPAAVTFTKDGQYILRYLAYANSWEDQIHQEIYSFDTTPPVTTATPCGVTFTGSGSVTLSANELATIYYTLNGQTPSPGTAYTFSGTTSVSLTITQDTTVNFLAIDTIGNIESPFHSCSFQVVQEYDEDFTSQQYDDITVTTTDWNTGLGLLLLKRLTPVLAGQFTTTTPSQDVAASGRNAYIADSNGLRVFDVSNPSQPNPLATYTSSSPFYSVKISGNYAYVGSSSGLVVINISNPASPQLVGQVSVGNPTGTYVQDVEVSGDYALLADQGQGLVVISLTVIGNPKVLTKVDLLPNDVRGVALSGNYVIVADGANGLKIVDINISHPTFAGITSVYSTAGVANAVAVSGSYAFVGLTSGYLQAVDISNPFFPVAGGNPVQISTSSLTRVSIRGNYAYCSTGTGIQVVDITSPSAMVSVGSLQGIGTANSVDVSGHYAYMAIGTTGAGGLAVIRIGDPVNLTQAGQITEATLAASTTVYGSIGLLADGFNGLKVIDLTNPISPSLLAALPTMTNAARVSILGGNGSTQYALVADMGGMSHVVDISVPSAPFLAASFTPPGAVNGVMDIAFFGQSTTSSAPTVTAAYALMAQGPAGLKIVDFTNPLNPSVVFTVATTNATRIALNGNTAYIADRSGGVRIIDISNIRSPSVKTPLGTIDAQDLAVSGSYLFLADGSGGVKIYSITNPTVPSAVGSFTQATQAQGIAVAGPFAYVADGSNGLKLLDITLPNKPVLAQAFTTTQAGGVTAWGDYVLVSDMAGGLKVVRAFKNLTDYMPSGVGQSINVNSTLAKIPWAQMDASQNLPADTNISYYLSNNGGTTWELVTIGNLHTFASPAGSSLRWKAVLSTSDTTKSPEVDSLRITYKVSP